MDDYEDDYGSDYGFDSYPVIDTSARVNVSASLGYSGGANLPSNFAGQAFATFEEIETAFGSHREPAAQVPMGFWARLLRWLRGA